jgi:transcription initiation factor TFIID subunit 6
MKNSKHDVLSVDNVNFALRSLNFDEVFGHSGRRSSLRFLPVPGYPNDVYVLEEKVYNLPDVMAEKLPLCPRDCTIDLHWLAVEGVQPRITENPVIDNGKKRKLGVFFSLQFFVLFVLRRFSDNF